MFYYRCVVLSSKCLNKPKCFLENIPRTGQYVPKPPFVAAGPP